MCAISGPVSAGTTHIYYDAQGRVLGALNSGAQGQRTSRTDNADNPSYLHIFPVVTNPGTDTLPVYGVLIADEQLTSSDGRFKFVVQEDGNAVVYQGSTALWATNTAGHQPGWFTVGGNGNLVFWGPDDVGLWGVQISGGTGTNAKLVMQSDGNLVLSENGSVVWSTNTGGH